MIARVFAILFLLLLLIPGGGMVLFKAQTIDPLDNRKLANFPHLENETPLPTQITAYIDDHFVFRQELIQLRMALSQAWFQQAPLTNLTRSNVLIGRDGWLFLMANGLVKDTPEDIPSTARKMKTLVLGLQARGEALKKKDLIYLFFVPPDKQGVYPEFLPAKVSNPAGRTRLDFLETTLLAHPDAAPFFLTPKPALLAAKPLGHELYFRTDTHWNLLGGYIGYRALLERLNEELSASSPPASALKILEIPLTRFQKTPAPPGDLGRMARLNLADFQLTAETHQPEPLNKKTVLFLHDSFGSALLPYLEQTFQKVIYVPQQLDDSALNEWIEREHPDIVIQERLELFIVDRGNSSDVPFPEPQDP